MGTGLLREEKSATPRRLRPGPRSSINGWEVLPDPFIFLHQKIEIIIFTSSAISILVQFLPSCEIFFLETWALASRIMIYENMQILFDLCVYTYLATLPDL